MNKSKINQSPQFITDLVNVGKFEGMKPNPIWKKIYKMHMQTLHFYFRNPIPSLRGGQGEPVADLEVKFAKQSGKAEAFPFPSYFP